MVFENFNLKVLETFVPLVSVIGAYLWATKSKLSGESFWKGFTFAATAMAFGTILLTILGVFGLSSITVGVLTWLAAYMPGFVAIVLTTSSATIIGILATELIPQFKGLMQWKTVGYFVVIAVVVGFLISYIVPAGAQTAAVQSLITP